MKHAADHGPGHRTPSRPLCARRRGARQVEEILARGTLQRASLRRPPGQIRGPPGGQAAAAGPAAVVGPGLRPAPARAPRAGRRHRNDPHRHAHPRRRARRGHAPPPPRHRQFPLEQRDQRPVGRLPGRPRHLPGQLGRWHVRLPGHRPGRPHHVRGRAPPGRRPRQLRTGRGGVPATSSPTRRPP